MTGSIEKPTYFSILTADVRYDENLSPAAKLLFSEITALCNKSGKCWASNAYFARLYGVQSTTISDWITQLKNRGHIDVCLEGRQRIISIGKNLVILRENPKEASEKAEGSLRKKPKQNNTSINNKINTKENNKSALQKTVEIYSAFWKDMYGTDYEVSNWGRLGSNLKSLLAKHNEWQVATLVWLHFNWHGASGEDKFVYKNLSEKFFPLEWIPNGLNGYKAYLINMLNVKWDDEEEVKKFILPELNKVNYGKEDRQNHSS